MVPHHLEVFHLVVVGITFLACHRREVVDIEGAGILIALGIGRLCRQAPRTTRVDFTRQCQIGILAQRQIVTAIAQVEATVIVLAEGWHQNTALVLLAEGEITEGYRNGQWQVFQYHISWARHYILLGFDLGLGELEVEVRMLMVVTGGVSAVLDVIIVILGLLGDAACEEAFTLLGDDVGGVAALGLEVVFHHLGLIFAAVVLEHRVTDQVAHCVGNADGLYLAAVHVHADLGSGHVDVSILDIAVTIHYGLATSK